MWTDSTVSTDFLQKMKPYQRINHFPAMFQLSKKSNLCKNLMRLRRAFPRAYNFFPRTWVLPREMSELQ